MTTVFFDSLLINKFEVVIDLLTFNETCFPSTTNLPALIVETLVLDCFFPFATNNLVVTTDLSHFDLSAFTENVPFF